MALHTKVDGDGSNGQRLAVYPLLAGEVESVPKHRMPDMAYQIVNDFLRRLLVRLEKQTSPAHDESYTGFSH